MSVSEKQYFLSVAKAVSETETTFTQDHPSASEVLKSASLTEEEKPELDVIERLRTNIKTLNDLQLRLGFMNTEIQSVIGLDCDSRKLK